VCQYFWQYVYVCVYIYSLIAINALSRCILDLYGDNWQACRHGAKHTHVIVSSLGTVITVNFTPTFHDSILIWQVLTCMVLTWHHLHTLHIWRGHFLPNLMYISNVLKQLKICDFFFFSTVFFSAVKRSVRHYKMCNIAPDMFILLVKRACVPFKGVCTDKTHFIYT